MFNHEPESYSCPFCSLIAGNETDQNKKQDIVFENKDTIAIIAPLWWPNNPGGALVIPKQHIENIYDMPDDLVYEVYKVVKRLSVAIRNTYECSGTSNRQHNEPDGGQDVWHFHVHVFPRHSNDKLYQQIDQGKFAGADDRMVFADKLRRYLN